MKILSNERVPKTSSRIFEHMNEIFRRVVQDDSNKRGGASTTEFQIDLDLLLIKKKYEKFKKKKR